MAQTMPDALFEPVLVVATLHSSSVAYFVKLELIHTIKFSLIAKIQRKKKDYSSSAQMTHPASSGPVLVIATLCRSPCHVFCK